MGLSPGDYIPRGVYADMMYRCANHAGEVRSDGQPAGVGAPVRFDDALDDAAVSGAGAAVHVAAPVLSGRALRVGGKAEVLGVLHAVAEARYYDAKRAHAANVGALGGDSSSASSSSSFSLAADLTTVARGLARAKTRVEELQRLEMAKLHAVIGAFHNTDTAASSRVAATSASLKFKFILKNKKGGGAGSATAGTVAGAARGALNPSRAGAAPEPEPEEPQGPPPEIDALMRKRETATLQMTEHTKALEQFIGAKRKVEQIVKKGALMKNTMGELRRRKVATKPVVAMCTAVLTLLNPTNKGIRGLLDPATYRLPQHENQLITMWMQLKPFINPLTMTNQMVSFAPDRIIADISSDVAAATAGEGGAEGDGEPERRRKFLEEEAREAFRACQVLMQDWSYETAARSGAAYGAMHEWSRVACSVRHERDAVDALAAEIARIDDIVSAAGWEVTTLASAAATTTAGK